MRAQRRTAPARWFVPLRGAIRSTCCSIWACRRCSLQGMRIAPGFGLWGTGRGNRAGAAWWKRSPGPIPEQWKHLDVSTPFLRAALESSEPLRVELGQKETILHLGPLVGMRSAIWIRLRTRNHTFGLAMVAHARPGAHPDMEVLRARAGEIALAIRHHRDSRRMELASEEIHAQSRLSRAILCGVSADFIIPQIAHTARHHLRAEFIAVGRGSEPPVSGEGWDGPDEWAAAIRQGPLLQLWRKAFETGQPCELPGESVAARPSSLLDSSPTTLERVVAIPIEVRNRPGGVLMAGLERFGRLLRRRFQTGVLCPAGGFRPGSGIWRGASEQVGRNCCEL